MENVSQIHSINQVSPSVLATYSVSFCDKFSRDKNSGEFSEEEEDTRDDACLLNSKKSKNSGSVTSIPPVAVSTQKSSQTNKCVKRSNSACCQCHSKYSFSCPVSSLSNIESESSDAIQYGSSLPAEGVNNSKTQDPANNSNTHRVVYCVHGKPSGCCASLISIDGENGNAEAENRLSSDTITIYDEHYCHTEERNVTDDRARKKLIIASILCIIFMIGEIIGGYLSNSLAIATDAAHLLTDFASFMISLFAIWVAGRPATRSMPFGWYRAEVIGALTSVLLIWIVTGILVYMAIERIIKKDFEIDASVMLVTSTIGVFINIVMGLSLHQHGHSHGGKTAAHAENGAETHHKHQNNINVRAAFIHVIGDFIQSFGVLLAAIIIYFKPEYNLVDPICTFLFSILVLITTFAIIRDTMVVLMEGIPNGVNFTDVLDTFLSIDGVVRVHNLRIWALSLDKTALSAHLAIRSGVNSSQVLKSASRKIHSKFNFFEMTLQIEEFHEQMENCAQCQPPAK